MKVSKKILAVTMSAAVITSIAAAGTLAYLTSQDTAVNTFTVGKVNITLDEAKVGPDGKADPSGERVKENVYENILPGAVLDKDPTVTVEAGSADCYVYVAVRNYLADRNGTGGPGNWDNWYGGFDVSDNWDYSYFIPYDPGFPNNVTRDISTVEIFRYIGPGTEDGVLKSSDEDIVLESVFEDGKFYIYNSLTSEQVENMYGDRVVVKAFAIQADNLVYDGPNGSGKTGLEAANQMASDYFSNDDNWEYKP